MEPARRPTPFVCLLVCRSVQSATSSHLRGWIVGHRRPHYKQTCFTVSSGTCLDALLRQSGYPVLSVPVCTGLLFAYASNWQHGVSSMGRHSPCRFFACHPFGLNCRMSEAVICLRILCSYIPAFLVGFASST